MAERLSAPPFTSRCRALYSRTTAGEREIILAKPQTFMNLSGQSVLCLIKELNVFAADSSIWIAHDDIDLERNGLRLRPGGGGHGGHNGLRSVMSSLGSGEFSRIKLGVGRPPGRQNPADYVLQRPGDKEWEGYDDLLERAADAVEHALRHGFYAAMNEFNTKGTP